MDAQEAARLHRRLGGPTTHRGGWGGAWGTAAEPPIEEVRQDILDRIAAIQRKPMRDIAADPDKRAAWEVLRGPRGWAADDGT